MDGFGALRMLGGLGLFLFGMDAMVKALRRRAGGRLETALQALTASPAKGFLLGLAATAAMQSSAATAAVTIGLVGAGAMRLRQACGVLIGVNVGATAAMWLPSLAGGLRMPEALSCVAALTGAALALFARRNRAREAGAILLGFAAAMFGMGTMAAAARPLAQSPALSEALARFSSPVFGVPVGAALAAVVQPPALTGALQSLAAAGALSYAGAISIVAGQNIGACATALITSAGAGREARRAAFVHLCFNVTGAAGFLALYALADVLFGLPFSGAPATQAGVAAANTALNLIAAAALLPFSRQLERLARLTVRGGADGGPSFALDAQLLGAPALAVEQSRRAALEAARAASAAFDAAVALVGRCDATAAETVEALARRIGRYEDAVAGCLAGLGARGAGEEERRDAAMLLRLTGDFRRVGDCAARVAAAARELTEKGIPLPDAARRELRVLAGAAAEALTAAVRAFETGDLALARRIEPLERAAVALAREMEGRRAGRLLSGACAVRQSAALAGLTSDCERVAVRCSSVAAALLGRAPSGSEPLAAKYRLPDA